MSPSPDEADERSAPRAAERSVARLAAVQALFQIEFGGADADTVIAEFSVYRLDREIEGLQFTAVDRAWFDGVVRGVTARHDALDARLLPLLGEGWSLQRLGGVVRAVLRAAAYELVACPNIPARVVVSEYVDVVHAFDEGGESAFVNAALDRLARDLRAAEFEQAGDG